MRKLILLCLVMFFVFVASNAQKTIKLSFSNTKIEQVLSQIEVQSGYNFIFTDKTLDINKLISVDISSDNIDTILKSVFHGMDITYKITDKKIILKSEKSSSTQQGSRKTINGVVKDNSGEPIIGANVKVKGSTVGTITDINGNFSLDISKGDALQISYIGYSEVNVRPSGDFVDIVMREDTQNLNEVVVVGYGTQKKVNLTGAVSSLNTESIEDLPTASLTNALAGKISGVLITSAGGKPGLGSKVQVRSVGTWNNATPLYVIDGIVRDQFAFDGLDASEVESISVLKDGASAAIYGARAANGVILVNTKKGKIGKPQITYTGSIGWEDKTKIPDMMNAYQQATIINDALAIQGYDSSSTDWFTDDELNYYKNNSYDWLDEVWRTPLLTRHSVNVNGGTEHVRYFMGGTYFYETGSFDNLNFKKYNIRSRIEADITKDLKASVNLSMDVRNDKKPYWRWDYDEDTMYDLYKALLFRSPMAPPYIDGMPVREIGGNIFVEWSPMEIIDGSRTGYNKKKYSTYDATASLQYDVPFIEGLSLKLVYNKFIKHQFIKQFCFPYTMYNFKGTGTHNHIPTNEVVGTYERNDGNYLQEQYESKDSYQLNGSVTYDNQFGKHHVSGLFVYEQSEGFYDYLWARGYDYATMNIDQLNWASSDNQRIFGSGLGTGRISYVGRANYSYNDRYLFEASFRYDGSPKFAPDKRWGFFPSASAAWRISEENFFKENIKGIDYMKIRASVGLLGNDAIDSKNALFDDASVAFFGNDLVGGWQWMQRYKVTTNGAIFGKDALTEALMADAVPNKNITWEKSLSWNFGIDTRSFNNRFTANLDVFFKHTYDILGDRLASLPTTMGITMPSENYAVIDGKGFELELGWNDKIGKDIDYYVKGNFSYATNKLVKKDEAENIRAYQSALGLNYDRKMGYISTGIIRTQEQLDALPDNYTIFGKKPELGMLNYRDLRGVNSDEPDGIIDENDQDWIVKHTIPPFNFGLSLGTKWKGLSIDIFLQGVAGNDVMMDMRDPQTRISESTFEFWADHWTADNVNATYPRVAENQGGYYSTFWRKDGSFVRLKNLNIGYDLPKNILDRIGVQNVKVFFNGTNLCLLYDKVKLYDPEALSMRNYPLTKSYSFGVNVSF